MNVNGTIIFFTVISLALMVFGCMFLSNHQWVQGGVVEVTGLGLLCFTLDHMTHKDIR